MLTGRRVLVTGGTGSLGRELVRRLLSGDLGTVEGVTVFSRDEAKQHEMRRAFEQRAAATDGLMHGEVHQRLRFRIGDITDFHSVAGALRNADVVFNAAALKQVPSCEYAPMEAVRTNILGPENIVRAIRDLGLPVDSVICVSTDKACKPVNVMGMTKAIQERVFVHANLECPGTRFVGARYGNVLASRGSVIPLFHDQIRNGGPVTVTAKEMTRFLLSLDQAVDAVFAAVRHGRAGEIYVPRVPSARITDIAAALIGDRSITIDIVGIRPGEKIHESLVSEEESGRTVVREGNYAILPALPELRADDHAEPFIDCEYSSSDEPLDLPAVADLLRSHRLLVEDEPTFHR